MRWYSYVPEEDAEEGAVFAPTIELNFAEKIPDDSVVRICLSYRASVTLGTDGTENKSTDQSDLEVMCAYTATNWLLQDWQLKWNQQIKPTDLPKFVAGTTNDKMATDQVQVVAETGWDIEATYVDVATGKDVLLDLSRWQDILMIDDKTNSINPLIMYPSSGDKKNEIDLIFSYAVYPSGTEGPYPTNQVKGDITVSDAGENPDLSAFTFSKQTFSILNAQQSGVFMYAFATSAAVISTFASLI